MRGEKTIADADDPEERWWYRVGGLSALVLGLAYILIVALYVSVGAPPSSGEAWLTYAAGKTTVWWAILGLSVLTDVLFVPVAVALYVALKRVDRTLLLPGPETAGGSAARRRRDVVPHQVPLRDAVQQQHRRALSAPKPVDRRAGRGDVDLLETVGHCSSAARLSGLSGGHDWCRSHRLGGARPSLRRVEAVAKTLLPTLRLGS